MTGRIADILLARLSDFVATTMGLNFPKERWRDLDRGMRAAVPDLGFGKAEPCIQWLLSSAPAKRHIEILASHLTVGETYFFREKASFEALENPILPALIRSRQKNGDRNLRIWSAGCCTGEESYSIAITITKLIPDLTGWNITILATDINSHFLEKALHGEYGEWSFRSTPATVKDSYFIRKDGRYAILPQIRKLVTFSYLNLAEDVYPSLVNGTNGMDIIFCRNVLMYFTPEQAGKVIRKLHHSLVDGGWLLTSAPEVSSSLFSRFAAVSFPGLTAYRKDSIGLPVAETVCSMPSIDEVTIPAVLPAAGEDQPWPPEIPCSTPAPQEDRGALHMEVAADAAKPSPSPYEEGLALYKQGHYSGAIVKLLALDACEAPDQNVYPLLVRAYADQGKIRSALEWCEKAIAADRLNPGLYYLKATILQEQGAIEEAIVSLRQALYLDQDFVLAHFALGTLALRQRKITQSGKYFRNALSLLNAYGPEQVLPESEGITAGRLGEIITVYLEQEMKAG